MNVRRARYSKAEQVATSLLSKAGIRSPAVDIEGMMNQTGIEIRAGNLGAISGLIARREGRVIVCVNSNHTAQRQRFTMAHEYGHYFLHEGLVSHSDESFRVNYRDVNSSTATDVDEIEANYFAACILMPKSFLDELNAAECLDNDAEVKRMAKRFDVSQHAMSLRLAHLYARYKPF